MLNSLSDLYAGIFQYGYVVSDISRATSWFEQEMGTVPFVGFTALTVEDCLVDGKPADDWTIDVAVVNVGSRNIELIRPVSGPVDMYRDAVRPDAYATFHHFGIKVESFAQVADLIAARGRTLAMSGYVPDFARFGYVDMRAELGHYVEFVELEPAGIEYFAALQAASSR